MALSVEQFVENLAHSGLLSETEISDFQGSLAPEQCKDAESLARELIRARRLTKYQALAVYQGKTQGLLLGEYVVLDKLGEGGMGAVLKAFHRRMKRLVAIKILPPSWTKSPENLKRFYREVEAAARLVHPNVVTSYDAGRHEGTHYLVMEYIDGEDLATWLRRHGPMSIEQAVDCCLQVATGLQYAHAKGVIHRDIKPGNLLLNREGTVKILDLGLAYLIATPAADDTTGVERLTVSGQVVGTCDYMAPEQAQSSKQVDHRADIYSLGCTLYRLLTGQPPYRGGAMIQVLLAHCNSPIPSLCEARPEVPAALDAIFQKMVAKRPEDRFQSMGELVAALTAFRKGKAKGTPVSNARANPEASARRRILVLAGLGGLVACGLIVAIVLAWTSRSRSPRPEGTLAVQTQPVSANHSSATPQASVKPVGLSLAPKPRRFGPHMPVNSVGIVARPASIPGVRSWSIESWRHRSYVWDVAYSPDGSLLASAGMDGTIRLWRSRLELAGMCVGHSWSVNALAWSPDGRYLASVGSDQTVFLWEVPSGNVVGSWLTRASLHAVAWSPDGTQLAIGGAGKDVELRGVPSGAVRTRLLKHTGAVRGLVWSPDGRQLISCSDDKTVRLWDIAGESSRVLEECDSPVTRLASSPDKTTLAWISNDKITLYDTLAGSIQRTIEVKGREPRTGLCWAPDGRTLAVCQGEMISWWDAASGKRLREVIPEKGLDLYSLAWSPDGRELAVGAYGCLRLRDAATGQGLYSQDWCTGIVGALPVWSSDGKTLAFHPAGLRGVWDLSTGEITGYPTAQQMARGLCRSPDGKRLAVVQSSLNFGLYDATFETRLSTFGQWAAEVVLLAWSPDGQWIASLDLEGTVQVWNATDGQRRIRWKIGTPATLWRDMLLWSPDSTRLLTRGANRSLRVWNAATGEAVHTLNPAEFPVAWSADGKQIASCGREKEITLWDAESGRSIRTIPELSLVHGLVWSADGKILKVCSANGTRYCDVATGTVARTVPIVNDIVIPVFVNFSPNQKYAVARYEEGSVRLLEIDSGRVLRTVLFLPGSQHLVLTDDGHYLGTPGAENEFCYVVMTDQGQELLRPAEFVKKYNWKNDPAKVKLQME